jgi:hypothetical protein
MVSYNWWHFQKSKNDQRWLRMSTKQLFIHINSYIAIIEGKRRNFAYINM